MSQKLASLCCAVFKSFYGVTFKEFVTADLPHLKEMPKLSPFLWLCRRLSFFVDERVMQRKSLSLCIYVLLLCLRSHTHLAGCTLVLILPALIRWLFQRLSSRFVVEIIIAFVVFHFLCPECVCNYPSYIHNVCLKKFTWCYLVRYFTHLPFCFDFW